MVRVGPFRLCAPPRALGKPAKLVQIVFVRILGMDGLTLGEGESLARQPTLLLVRRG